MNGANYHTHQNVFSCVLLGYNNYNKRRLGTVSVYALHIYGVQLIPSERPNLKTNDLALLSRTQNANLCQRIIVIPRAAD